MSEGDLERVKEIFNAVLALHGADRESRLTELCAGDEALREEVLSLLSFEDAEDPRLQTAALGKPLGDVLFGEGREAESAIPRALGPYEILDVLGCGGMGTVYRARQHHPDRIVALKVIRPGYVNRELHARFEHETRILGRLQHPGIAQIFHAGSLSDSHGEQPFFAMELVDGLPLDEYAKDRELTIDDRLRLIMKVCRAIQHAHQKGVIHRDLKPGNILVTDDEETGTGTSTSLLAPGLGQPKVLDFGIARITDADVRTMTLQTGMGQLLGTLPYMSPEQLSGDAMDIDARSDVYSIGVLLYELLVGNVPHDVRRLALPEAISTIREGLPKKLGSVDRRLRGDVETIVAKALAKDPSRRYPTAIALSNDIERYLDHKPIEARPASAFYHFGKFASRNRLLVGSAGLVFLLLILAVAGTSYGLKKSNEEKVKAEQARVEALASADQARVVRGFFLDIFAMAIPERGGADVTVLEAVDRAALRIDGEFAGQPVLASDVHSELGMIYLKLGRSEDAEEHFRTSLDIRRDELGEEHEKTWLSMYELSLGLIERGRREGEKPLKEAEELLRGALEATEGLEGEEASLGVNLWSALALLEDVRHDTKAASEATEKALELSEAKLGAEDLRTLDQRHNRAVLLMQEGKLQEAETILLEVLEKRIEIQGENNADVLITERDLALIFEHTNRLDEARTRLTRILAIQNDSHGEGHRETLRTRYQLARVTRAQSDVEAAIDEFEAMLELAAESLGEQDAMVVRVRDSLAGARQQRGELAVARDLFLENYEVLSSTLGAEDPYAIAKAYNVAILSLMLKEWEEALAMGEEALGNLVDEPDAKKAPVHLLYSAMAQSLYRLERHDEARDSVEECLRLIEVGGWREDHPTRVSLNDLAHVMLESGDREKADEVARLIRD